MLLVRPSKLSDLPQIERMARSDGPVLHSLPPDRDRLQQRRRVRVALVVAQLQQRVIGRALGQRAARGQQSQDHHAQRTHRHRQRLRPTSIHR